MKQLKLSIMIVLLAAAFSVKAHADDTFELDLEYGVDPINDITISDGEIYLTVNSAIAGREPSAATDTTSTYDITTNEPARKITAQLSSGMPSNTSLKVSLVSVPEGWTSSGEQFLSADMAVTLATGDQGGGTGLMISYTFAAGVSAGIVTQGSRTVTYTLSAQ